MYLKQILFLLLFIVFTINSKAQPSWKVEGNKYEYDMTITGVISLNDTLVENTKGIIVGAFDANSNCVGKAEARYYGSVKKYRVPLMIHSNQNGEKIYLKAYIPEQSSILKLSTIIEFAIDESLGNFETPFVWETDTTINSNDLPAKVVSVFPNPAKDLLNVHVQNDRNPYTMLLLGIKGELITEKKCQQKRETLDISWIKSGIYILQIKSSKGVFSEKFIKK